MQSFVKKLLFIFWISVKDCKAPVEASSSLDRISGLSECEISLLVHGMGQPSSGKISLG
jgi:hypothetical protein